MAETQRPVTQEALAEPSGDQPLWRDVPSWFVFGEEDRNIPTAVQQFMAERAGAARCGRGSWRLACDRRLPT